MRKKLLSILLMCCMVLGTATMQVSALDENVDRNVISNNISKIVAGINASSDKDSDGKPIIKYSTDEETIAFVSIKNNQLHFSYNKATNIDDTYVDMYVDIPYSEEMKVTVDVYDEASSSETENDIQDAEAKVNPSTFDWNYNNTVKFTINPDSKKAQKKCNIVYGDAMELWNNMLFDKIRMSICHLGFSNLCNHGWKDIEFVRPTKVADGLIVNVCQACALIDKYVIPADSKAIRYSGCSNFRWLSYKKLGGNSKITVSSKTGKLTVKKGLKKGTYKVKIKVNTVANDYYDASSKIATVTVKNK